MAVVPKNGKGKWTVETEINYDYWNVSLCFAEPRGMALSNFLVIKAKDGLALKNYVGDPDNRDRVYFRKTGPPPSTGTGH